MRRIVVGIHFAVAIYLSLSPAASALTLTIDFNSISGWTIPGGPGGDRYEQDGFLVQTEDGVANPNSPALGRWEWTNGQFCNFGGCSTIPHTTIITFLGGTGLFDLNTVQIVNNLSGMTFTADGGQSATFQGNDFGVKTLNFQDITTLRIDISSGAGAYQSIDNLVVTPVPEPSVALLAALGLLGLAAGGRMGTRAA